MDILDDELKFRHLKSGTPYIYIRINYKKEGKNTLQIRMIII